MYINILFSIKTLYALWKKCRNHKIWASLCKIPVHSNLLFIVLWKQCLTCSRIIGTTKDTVKFTKNNISITYMKNSSSSSLLPRHHINSNDLYICRFLSRNLFLINSINLVVMNRHILWDNALSNNNDMYIDIHVYCNDFSRHICIKKNRLKIIPLNCLAFKNVL